jgi:hypothetical protein
MLAARSALVSMKSRRGSTSSSISMINTRLASIASSICTRGSGALPLHQGFPQLLGGHRARFLLALARHHAFGFAYQPAHGLAEIGHLLFAPYRIRRCARSPLPSRPRRALTAASELFEQRGFEPSSMEEITSSTPCSKVTPHLYFDSKEYLVYEATVEPIDADFRQLYQVFEQKRPTLDQILLAFGERFIQLITSKPV